MSVSEVMYFRKAGDFNEAYDIAVADWQYYDNPWTRMAVFWVLRDICQWQIRYGNMPAAHKCLTIMAQLLPDMMDAEGYGRKSYEYLCRCAHYPPSSQQ